MGLGDCFEVHARMVLDQWFKDRERPILLVHGVCIGRGPIEGIEYSHCWLEENGMVYDFSNGKNIVIPKFRYYELGQIKEGEGVLHRYTLKEAREMMSIIETYGPWELDCEL